MPSSSSSIPVRNSVALPSALITIISLLQLSIGIPNPLISEAMGSNQSYQLDPCPEGYVKSSTDNTCISIEEIPANMRTIIDVLDLEETYEQYTQEQEQNNQQTLQIRTQEELQSSSPEVVDPCPQGFKLGTSGRCEELQEQELQSPSTVTNPPGNFETYTNSTLGISIEYPSDWNIPPTYDPAPFFDTVFYVDDPLTGLGIKTVNVPSMITLDQIYTSTYALLPYILPNYRLIESGETTLLGMPAYQIRFTTDFNPEFTTEVTATFTLVDGRLYGLVYFADEEAFQANLSTADWMISSFKTN